MKPGRDPRSPATPLLPEQCHVTGFSLFITVFIVLGAAGMVLAGDSREAGGGKGAAFGVLAWGSELPLRGQPVQCLWAPTLQVACGGGAWLQRWADQKHHNPKEAFIGHSPATEENMAFLTSSSCAEVPQHAQGTPKTQL